MNAVRPARSVLARGVSASSTTAGTAPALPVRLFHTSSSRSTRRRSRFKNITAEQMGLTSPDVAERYAKRHFPDYTPEDLAKLRKRYTPEQMEAIEAAEDAIDPKDLAVQGRLRVDPYRQNYLEDFATIQPIIDAKPQTPAQPREVEWLPRREWVDNYVEKLADRVEVQLKDSMGRAYARALRKLKKENPDQIDFTEEELNELEKNPELRRKFLIEEETDVLGSSSTKPAPEAVNSQWFDDIDKEFYKELAAEFNTDKNPVEPSRLDSWKAIEGPDGQTALAPKLGKVEGVKGLYTLEDTEEEDLDPTGEFAKIKALTGISIRDIQTLIAKPIVVRSVHNQTRLGKIRSVSIITVAGNGDGMLGLGEAKSVDFAIAKSTARMLAIRNMKPIRRYENRTIYGEVQKKISGTVVKLQSRPPGFGLRVSHRIFEMARLAGIHDLSAKIMRSKNPYNTVKVVYECLTNQPDPEQIAIGRGKKLVDARKVYYGGSVY